MDVREKTTSKKRLIDADALLNEFLKRYTERERNRNLVFAACEIKQDFADMISDFQTVDAVEVVRCQECKHHYWEQEPCHGKSVHYCNLHHMSGVQVSKEFFCYYGERKEGADNG